ncbi:phytochrome-like protein cph2 [Anaerotignum neopropionicum]|uniref:Stage 0 sporulation protein A homolog n=1 Tax=Anaerotignum neopropionicum TaxID=36847 RepID=A0A136WFM6_9FIRM|nr:EAL domain-containing protein [Anaerotignum neopropionicum]KXL53304.1 phytochrome-like protein cph2 [Anaerotignum neopropionicum]
MPFKKNVLIVDDNKMNRQMLSQVLYCQYKILEAESGEEALELLHNSKLSISVVLLRFALPDMNGIEVLAEISRDVFLRKIPVVLFARNDELDSKTKAEVQSLGVQNFIQPPFTAESVRQQIVNAILYSEKAKLLDFAQRDRLTSLYAREPFYHLITEVLEKNPDKKYDILCSDIERFKLVNELFGSEEGDALLKFVAQMIEDKVKDVGICGRIGGDIFAALIPHQDQYSEQFFSESADFINQYNSNLHSVIKFGIYTIEDRTLPANIMCARACLALESIKGKYGMHCAYYDDSIRQKLLDEQFILSNMKSALVNREFVVFFQPKYDLLDEKICSAEALVRWKHPERGLIPPNQFIQIFENNGFITELDLYVLEETCKWVRSWIDRGNPMIPVSVNISRADIFNSNLDAILLSLLKKYGLDPSHIHLEITESAYTENAEQMIHGIKQLKELGFVIEMDDFGSGYSSLNMLSELPIDVLKLDMRFVQNYDRSRDKRNIMSFVISLAKWMNLKVVAEGVETEEQVNLLKLLGCHWVQGFFYSKPLPLDAFETLIEQVNFSNTEYTLETAEGRAKPAHNILRLDVEKKNMLILDPTSKEFEPFQSVFDEKYCILKANTMQETRDCIFNQKLKISIVIFSVTKEITLEHISEISLLCKQYDIPLITIHSSIELVKNAASLGAFHCIVKPYVLENLENTVENTLCRMKVVQLQKEIKFSDAIIEMKNRAEIDFLSGLLNHSELKIRMRDFYNQNHEASGVFILIDIDHFKSINTSFGYNVGNKVIHAVGKMLEAIFNDTNFIARIDGDLFAVFIPFQMERQVLEQKLERVCHAMAYDNSDVSLTIDCSVGVCYAENNTTTIEEMFNNAEIALLNARKNQKGRFLFYFEGMKAPLNENIQQQTFSFLDDVSDGVFVCDALSGEIIYINDAACKIMNMEKNNCIGAIGFGLFWNKNKKCELCLQLDDYDTTFYEHDGYLNDGETKAHIKVRIDDWNGRTVKIHYLQKIG